MMGTLSVARSWRSRGVNGPPQPAKENVRNPGSAPAQKNIERTPSRTKENVRNPVGDPGRGITHP
jgi:hypothetical protein